MNLRAAEKELRGRSPRVTPQFLAIEAVLMVSASFVLVYFFS